MHTTLPRMESNSTRSSSARTRSASYCTRSASDRTRFESLETRRLLAFAASGASTVTGDEFQSVDAITAVSNGYVVGGTFSAGSDFGNGFSPKVRGYSDVFLTLVRDSGTSTYAIGGGGSSDGKVRIEDDRAEFAALPRRVSEDFLFGVSSSHRRADEYIHTMKVGPDGKLYVVLVFRNEISLNTSNSRAMTLTSGGDFDLYDTAILKYSIGKKLAFEGVMQIAGPFNEIVNDIDFDSEGNLIAVGSFERQTDFDPSDGVKLVDPLGRNDAFVAKYTSDFDLVYISQFGGESARVFDIDAANGVAVDADDNIYVGGTFAETADFDPRAGKANRFYVEADDRTDAFTMKLNPNGTLNWVRTQGGEDSDGIRDVALAPNGGVYSVGYYEDEADLDPTSGIQLFRAQTERGDSNSDATDVFTNRFDADGNLVFVKPLAGDGFELIANIESDAGGSYTLTGSFFGTADFDPSRRQRLLTTPASGLDDDNQRDRDNSYSGFIAKYSANAKLIDVTKIDGRGEQDVFLNASAVDADGNVLIGGRYRLGFTAGSITIGTSTNNDTREDAFALIFNSGLDLIV